jgi:hypothetical protein
MFGDRILLQVDNEGNSRGIREARKKMKVTF